jgi:hypothetical protein
MFRYYEGIRDTWPAVTATSEGSRIVPGKRKQQTVYSTEYELKYRVDGRDYATPIAAKTWTSSRRSAEETASRYARGTSLTVWYDPSNPYRIRDDVGSARLFFLPALFTGLGIVLAGVGAFLYRLPVKEKRCPSCGRRSVSPHCGYCGRAQKNIQAKPPAARDRRASIIVGGVFGAVGLAMLAGGSWWLYRQFLVLASWPQITGTVVDRQFERRNVNGRLTFESRIRFEYSTGDQTLRNIAEPERSSNYAWIRQRYDRFEPGSQHPIHHDPADPARIRTHKDADLEFVLPSAILGGLGLVFALLGWYLLSPALKARRFCTACREEVARYDRYCRWCGEHLV